MPPESSTSFPWRLWVGIFRFLQGIEFICQSLEAGIPRCQLIDCLSCSLLPHTFSPWLVLNCYFAHGFSALGTWGLDYLYENLEMGITCPSVFCLVCSMPQCNWSIRPQQAYVQQMLESFLSQWLTPVQAFISSFRSLGWAEGRCISLVFLKIFQTDRVYIFTGQIYFEELVRGWEA